MSFDPKAFLAKRAAQPIEDTVSTQSAAPQGFDPKAFLARRGGRGPDQFLPGEAPPVVVGEGQIPVTQPMPFTPATQALPQGINGAEARTFLENAANEVSFGYLPQLQALAEKFMPDPGARVDEELRAQGFTVPESSYVQMRDENIARQQRMASENPEAAIAGMLAGVGVTAPIMGGVAKAAGLGAKAGVGARLRDAAKLGAATGAVYNPGDVEGELSPLQFADRGTNAVKGSAMGLAAQGAGDVIAKGGEAIKRAPEVAEKVGNITAVKAIGAIGRDMKKLFGKNNAHELGDTIVKKGILSAGDSLEEVAKKAATVKQETGKRIGEILKATDEELMTPEKLEKMSVRNRKLLEVTQADGDKLAEISLKKIEKNLVNNLDAPEIKGRMQSILLELQGKGKNISIKDLQEMKVNLDKKINYDKALKDMPEVQQQMKVVRDILNKSIQNRVRVLGRVSKNKGLIDELRTLNKEYGHVSKAEAIASSRAKEIEGHRFLSLTETISGSAGATIGAMTGDSPEERVKNALIGFAAGAATKKVDKFMTPAVAKSAKRLSTMLKAPANFAKFGEPLIEAAKRSPQEFQSVIQQLSNNPEFKKLANPGAR